VNTSWAKARTLRTLAAVVPLALWVRYSRQSLLTGSGHVAALGWLAVGALWCVALSGWASEPAGLLERWVEWADVPFLGGATPQRVLLVLGLGLAGRECGEPEVEVAVEPRVREAVDDRRQQQGTLVPPGQSGLVAHPGDTGEQAAAGTMGGRVRPAHLQTAVAAEGAEGGGVMYVGDSITDTPPLAAVKAWGGVSLSFNGNGYAIAAAEFAAASPDAEVQAQLAQAFAAGGRDAVEAAVRALEALPGIGAWTAQYIAMRALGWPDAFPASDLVVLKALGETRPARAAIRSEAWRPWRAYAVLHLWRNAT